MQDVQYIIIYYSNMQDKQLLNCPITFWKACNLSVKSIL